MNIERYTIKLPATQCGHVADLEIEIRTGKNTTAPYLNIDLEPCPEIVEISVCGTVWKGRRVDSRFVSGGQNIEEIAELYPQNRVVQGVAKIWRRWHLNGMNAGTRAQRDFLEAYRKEHPEWRYDYDEACNLLKGAGLYEDGMCVMEHLGSKEPRPYRYGTAWLAEAPPSEVVEELRALVAQGDAE